MEGFSNGNFVLKKGDYNKEFWTVDLTRKKYDLIHKKAEDILADKNYLSEYCFNHKHELYEAGWYDFRNGITKLRNEGVLKFKVCPLDKGDKGSAFYERVCEPVYWAYQSVFEHMKENMDRKLYDYDKWKSLKGKCTTTIFPKKKKKTDVTIAIAFCAKYMVSQKIIFDENGKAIDYKMLKMNETVERIVNKFGIDRMYRLAEMRRHNTFNLIEEPCKFTNLSFNMVTTCSASDPNIIVYNKNGKNGKTNCYIKLSGFGLGRGKPLYIPVTYSPRYHGDSIEKYMKTTASSTKSYTLQIKFNEKKKRVCANLLTDETRIYPKTTDKDEVIGCDVNVLHSLLVLSDGKSFDFDRKTVYDFCLLKQLIKKRQTESKDNSYVPGNKIMRKYNALAKRIASNVNEVIAECCKYLRDKGIHHISIENLQKGFGRSKIEMKDFVGINLNEVTKALRVVNIKNIFPKIARKYGIYVSIVPSAYTSITCPVCGCVHKDNRKKQEEFKCINCGYEDNADHNAALNIRNRVTDSEFREKFLKEDSDVSNKKDKDKMVPKTYYYVPKSENFRLYNKEYLEMMEKRKEFFVFD